MTDTRTSERTLTVEQARAFYNRLGSRQDWQRFFEDPAVEVMLRQGDFNHATSVLEFDCGTGRLAERLLLTEGAYLGHSLGFEVVERPWFSVHASPGLRLEPGMVIAPEWFAATSQGVFPWEENFLVTETGLEKLSDFPQELCVIAD